MITAEEAKRDLTINIAKSESHKHPAIKFKEELKIIDEKVRYAVGRLDNKILIYTPIASTPLLKDDFDELCYYLRMLGYSVSGKWVDGHITIYWG